MIEEKVMEIFEPLHNRISHLVEMMDRLIQGNSAGEFTTASTLELHLQSESLFTETPGTSIFPPVATLTTAG